jgi:hypothetical protein
MENQEAKIKEIEDKIYETYYKVNPYGDSRHTVWPAVIKAKKEKNVIKALKTVLKSVEEHTI